MPSRQPVHGEKRGADASDRSPAASKTTTVTSPLTTAKKMRPISYEVGEEKSALARLQEHPALLEALTAHGREWADVEATFAARSEKFLVRLLVDAKWTGMIDVIVASNAAPNSEGDEEAEPASLADEEEAEILRAFDHAEKFGPCVGITRLVRWLRAERHGLDPPARVKEILESIDDDDPAHESIFSRVVS